MTPLNALNVTIGTSLISLFLSLYMTLTHYVAGELPQWCSFGSYFSCADLLKSDWALLFQTPIALLGLAWNVVLLGIATHTRDELLRKARIDNEVRDWLASVRLFLLSGVIFVVYLVAIELHLGKICLLCTGVHFCTLIAAFVMRSHADWRPETVPSWSFVAFAVLLLAAPVVYSVATNPNRAATNTLKSLPLVDCLISQKVEIIAHERCSVCKLQKTFFERADEVYRVVEMSRGQEATFTEPLWLMDGKKAHQGLLTVADIKLKFKC